MPRYQWQGVTKQGSSRSGVLYAPDYTSLEKRLEQDGIGLVSVTHATAPLCVSTKDGDLFFMRLALLSAGHVPLYTALQMFAHHEQGAAQKNSYMSLADMVGQGYTLSYALQEHNMKDPTTIALVAAGEHTGTLACSLQSLVAYQREQRRLRMMLTRVLMAPAISFALVIGMVVTLTVFLIPLYEQACLQCNVAFPRATGILVRISALCRWYGWYLLFLCVVMGVLSVGLVRGNDVVRSWCERMREQVPVFGPLFRAAMRVRFCSLLGVLLEHKVPLEQALEVCAVHETQRIYQNLVLTIKKEVLQGTELSVAVGRSRLACLELTSLLRAAEHTGQVAQALTLVSKRLYEQLHYDAERCIAISGPLLTCLAACIVGGMMLLLYCPLISLGEGISSMV